MSSEEKGVFDGVDAPDYRKEIGTQMVRGAAVAGAVVFGPIILIYLIYLLGLLLPPEAREAVDPTPDSFPQLVEQEEASDDG